MASPAGRESHECGTRRGLSSNPSPWSSETRRSTPKSGPGSRERGIQGFVSRTQSLRPVLFGLGLFCVAVGCDDLWHKATGPRMSRGGDQGDELGAQAPPPNGPKLGALADFTPVYDQPAHDSRRIGWLHAGARVARSERPISKQDCTDGWYAIYPRGFVCIGQGATVDMNHPTLTAMSLEPKLNEPLPYPYAQTRVPTEVFAPNTEPEDGVHPIAKLREAATLAVVGSWQALDDTDQRQKLALTTRGTFVRVDDLRAVKLPPPRGVQIDGTHFTVPLGFVVGEHAKRWRLDGDEATPVNALASGAVLALGHKTRTLGDSRYCALEDGAWVLQSDVVVVRRRNDWPSFACGARHWVDLDVDDGIVVLYEGERAVFAAPTLTVPTNKRSLAARATVVSAKCVTDNGLDANHEVYDAPWVIELANGMRLYGSLRPSRRPALDASRVELTPQDAQRVWAWVAPALPQGWHAVMASSDADRQTNVLVR